MKKTHENFIKAIYHLSPSETYLVSTSAIADELEVSKSLSTEVVQDLSASGFVDYHRYQGVRLTKKGRTIALQIIRSHRLWEVFLVDKLGFNWDEVHDLAEELEHIRNDQFIDRLDVFLGSPIRDPHGDPIPTKEGVLPKIKSKPLNEYAIGEKGQLSRVNEDSEAFLRYLDKNQIKIGDQIELCAIEEFDGTLTVQVNGKELQISPKTASLLKLKS